MELDFDTMNEDYLEYEKIYFSLLEFVFDYLKYQMDPIVSVSIVDNATIHNLNKKFRNIDKDTDVLSFAFLDSEKENKMKFLNSRQTYCLGEIFISYEKAIEQAKEYGHSFKREMCFLFVHGLLHLCGFDHMNKEDEEKMFSLQKEILKLKGIDR